MSQCLGAVSTPPPTVPARTLRALGLPALLACRAAHDLRRFGRVGSVMTLRDPDAGPAHGLLSLRRARSSALPIRRPPRREC